MNEEEIKEEQVKDKLTRAELLAKARAVKAEKAKLKKTQETPATPKPKKEPKQKPTIEITELKPIAKAAPEPEIVEEVVRVPGNRHKKIIKRTIEIEESETDEEVVEEIVKIPKMKKEVKISRDEMKKKLVEANKQRLYTELFS
jgi:hypothetical protein